MLSSVLRSKQAVQVNISIMRAFVKLRELLSTNKELAHKLAQLERKMEKHDDEIKLKMGITLNSLRSTPNNAINHRTQGKKLSLFWC